MERLTDKHLKTLMFTVATNDKPKIQFNDTEFTQEGLNEALRAQFQLLAGDRRSYNKNKELIFQLLEETVDDLLPKRMFDSLNRFAEIQTVANGDKITFSRPKGRVRGRNFVTQVSPAGL